LVDSDLAVAGLQGYIGPAGISHPVKLVVECSYPLCMASCRRAMLRVE
jgi:hypothetical protein